MSELMRLIQTHLDRWGVSRAEFARRCGTTPQTIQNWQDRPTTLPKPEHLRGVAEVTGYPYLIVLDAALVDAGYREDLADDLQSLKVRIARYVRSDRSGRWRELSQYLNSRWLPDEDAFVNHLDPVDPPHSVIYRLIDQWIAEADQRQYGNDELFDQERILEFICDDIRDRYLAELDRVYNEPVDVQAFMEAMGLSRSDDDWWMDDVDTLARTYVKIMYTWGYRSEEFMDELHNRMPAPRERPTPTEHYEALYRQLTMRLEAEAASSRVQPAPPIGASPPTPVADLALRRGEKAAQSDDGRAALDEAIAAHDEGKAAAREGESEGRRMRDAHDADAEAGDDIDPAAGEGHADQGDAPDGGA